MLRRIGFFGKSPALVFIDTGIDLAEAVDDSETVLDVSADPTSTIPIGSVVQFGTDAEKALVTDESAGTALTVGSEAINRATSSGALSAHTVLDLSNPLNADGPITINELWFATSTTTLKVGLFRLVSGTTYKCIATATIGSVTQGSKQTKTGFTLNGLAGDYIGFYYTNGTIEVDTSGGNAYYVDSDQMTVDSEAVYSAVGAWLFSQKGLGTGTPSLTVTRGHGGTTPAAHDTGLDVMIGR